MYLDPQTISQLSGVVAEALAEQAELHVELAKAELARDTRALVRSAWPLVIGVPLVAVGVLLGNVTIAVALATWLGPWGGFAIVSGVNLIVGGLLVRHTVRALSTGTGIELTLGEELARSARGILAGLKPGRREVSLAR